MSIFNYRERVRYAKSGEYATVLRWLPESGKYHIAFDKGDYADVSAEYLLPTAPATPGVPFSPNADVVIQREMPKREIDPTGREASTPGAKLDAGKVRPDLILSGMPRALLAVAEVGTFGANKYTENGWMFVPDGAKRYTAAMDRHRLKESLEDVDGDSGLLHQAHLAWNALARLELALIELEEKNNA